MAPFLIGFAILAGAKFAAWFWRVFFAGHVLALVFVTWLFFVAVFDIGALCPYCMVAWAATIPLFWQLLAHGTREGYLPIPLKTVGFFVRAYDYAWVIALIQTLAIAVTILIHFWNLWLQFFGLSL